MKESYSNGHQVLSDGGRVWVNGTMGEAVARLACFGHKVMIDIHHPLCAQKKKGECLDCRHDFRPGADAWDYFVASLDRNFNVKVDEKHRPAWAVHVA